MFAHNPVDTIFIKHSRQINDNKIQEITPPSIVDLAAPEYHKTLSYAQIELGWNQAKLIKNSSSGSIIIFCFTGQIATCKYEKCLMLQIL